MAAPMGVSVKYSRCYFLNLFLLMPTNTRRPVPSSSIVAGSGMLCPPLGRTIKSIVVKLSFVL